MSTKAEIFSKLAIRTEAVKPKRTVFVIRPEDLRKVFEELIKTFGPESFYLSTIVGVDLPAENRMRLDYYIHLVPEGETVVIRTFIDRSNPVIDSIIDIIPGALAGESETFDLLGIVFKGNPYLKRGFFVPVDLVQKGIHPLRKDSGV